MKPIQLSVALSCLLTFVLAGCGERKTAPPAEKPAPARPHSAADASAAEIAGTESVVAGPSFESEDLEALEAAIRKYHSIYDRLPRTYDALIDEGLLEEIPAVPEGKRFKIDGATLKLTLVDE